MVSSRPVESDRHRKRFWRHHDRARYRCPDCGRRESHPDVCRFEVHHRDGDPSNGAPSNLVGLCRHCHYVRHDRTPPGSIDDWKAQIHSLGEASP